MNFKKLSLPIIVTFLLFSTQLSAESRKGYSSQEGQSVDELTYNQLQNNETFNQITFCYDKVQLERYPEIIDGLKKQSICYDKFENARELRAKINFTKESLTKLRLYREITELALKKAYQVQKDFANSSTSLGEEMRFALIPKGEIQKVALQKNQNHKPLCKTNTSSDIKIPVQACDIKESNALNFSEYSKDQIARLKSNLQDIQSIFNNSKDTDLGMIDSVRLIIKASSLADDLVLIDIEGFKLLNQFFNINSENSTFQNSDIVSYVNLNIFQQAKNSDNPSGKIVITAVKYPNIDKDFNITGYETKDLPNMYLSTFNEQVIGRLIAKLKDRLGEYDKMIKEFSNNEKLFTQNLDNLIKDSSCFTNQIASISPRPESSPSNNSAENFDTEFKEVTIFSFAKGIYEKIVAGAVYTLSSIKNSATDIISINPSPTPESGVVSVIKKINNNQETTTSSSDNNLESSSQRTGSSGLSGGSGSVSTPSPKPNINTSTSKTTNTATPTPSTTAKPRTSTTASPSPSSTISPSPSPTRSPSPTPSSTPTPTPSTTISPSPTITPTPTPTPTPSSTPTPSLTPSPTPSTTISPSPTITPIPTPTPSNSPRASYNQPMANLYGISKILFDLIVKINDQNYPILHKK